MLSKNKSICSFTFQFNLDFLWLDNDSLHKHWLAWHYDFIATFDFMRKTTSVKGQNILVCYHTFIYAYFELLHNIYGFGWNSYNQHGLHFHSLWKTKENECCIKFVLCNFHQLAYKFCDIHSIMCDISWSTPFQFFIKCSWKIRFIPLYIF